MSKKLKTLFRNICVFSFFIFPLTLSAYYYDNKPKGYVNDFANVLKEDEKAFLEDKIKVFNASTSNEIAVAIIPDLEGEYIEKYAVKLFEKWGIGNSKKDNGVLLLIAMKERSMRIEVGYGLEGVLTDINSSYIIRNEITPLFKSGNYYEGILKGVDSIISVTKGEYVMDKKDNGFNFSPEIIFFFFIGLIQFLAAILSRSKSFWLGGVIGGVVGIILTLFGIFGLTLVVGGILTVVLILVGLIFDYVVSHLGIGNIISGGGFGSGRGFGGGGGFGGFGGGRSGGGGSSGNW